MPNPNWRSKFCPHCAAGNTPLNGTKVHKVYPINAAHLAYRNPIVKGPLSEYLPCTAPTAEEYIAQLEAKVTELEMYTKSLTADTRDSTLDI